MSKLTTIGATALITLAVPTLAFTITPTRNAILSLAPDEQILALADKIDESRVTNDAKINELQTQISDQQKVIDDQKKTIETSQKTVETVKADIAATNTVVAKQKNCSADVAKYCTLPMFKDKAIFNDAVANVSHDKDQQQKYRDQFSPQFDNCQKALNC